ncbi:CBS domain-containing protein [Humidesulfovibrio mexicanus]|uniref:CBS domain-containing protein n=1 Tax=Humidesulfovibrio mexicanus TaxID=147047 RepID=A0A238ZSM2_9BACT|nr:nucleotidyltransferase family protein [Humidesulfovibrio mexicanus]SNR86132.1 CBS domain-containing protein [Humidesulfovibrio mexicanus]
MPKDKWKQVLVAPETPAMDAVRLIDSTRMQIALVVDASGRLLGTVTDGDVRRAIISGVPLTGPVADIMFRTPTTAPPEADHEALLSLMQTKVLRQIPIVDAAGRVVGLESMMDLLSREVLPNAVVLMAGGRGQRLRPLTDLCPKPLLRIGDKPILEIILETFVAQGFRTFYISINYMAEKVVEHFGDGSRFGASISYLREDQPMGTAGALTLLPPMERPFLVMNGDLLTKVNFAHLLDFHESQGAAATMCVRPYTTQIPYGVVHVEDHKLVRIEEKPTQTVFVNAGIYALSPDALARIPSGQAFDMPALFETLVAEGAPTLAFPVREYWIDIGRVGDYEQAQTDYSRHFG